MLRADAVRFARRYPGLGWLGVSAFYASNPDEVDALCHTKLNRFEQVAVFRRADLAASLITVVATFRTPHVTLAAENLDVLLLRLLSCPHTIRVNPYYESDESEVDR
ncbi:MAG: hypothetical protein FWD74_08890 [Actinomycetia bacterium]|nr:hypothetical protein [Actinomycetes bacterium]